jgi:hypothetical protein
VHVDAARGSTTSYDDGPVAPCARWLERTASNDTAAVVRHRPGRTTAAAHPAPRPPVPVVSAAVAAVAAVAAAGRQITRSRVPAAAHWERTVNAPVGERTPVGQCCGGQDERKEHTDG